MVEGAKFEKIRSHVEINFQEKAIDVWGSISDLLLAAVFDDLDAQSFIEQQGSMKQLDIVKNFANTLPSDKEDSVEIDSAGKNNFTIKYD